MRKCFGIYFSETLSLRQRHLFVNYCKCPSQSVLRSFLYVADSTAFQTLASMSSDAARVIRVVKFLSERVGGKVPEFGIICGSGLGGLAKTLDNPVTIHYDEIVGFPKSTVQGHAGSIPRDCIALGLESVFFSEQENLCLATLETSSWFVCGAGFISTRVTQQAMSRWE